MLQHLLATALDFFAAMVAMACIQLAVKRWVIFECLFRTPCRRTDIPAHADFHRLAMNMVECAASAQAHEEIPILQACQRFVEVAHRKGKRTRAGKGVDRDVVVNQQTLPGVCLVGIALLTRHLAALARRYRFLNEYRIRVHNSVGVVSQGRSQCFKVARQIQVVIVQIGHITATGQSQSAITGSGWAAITALADIGDREIALSQQRFDRVAVVIDQDDFEVLEGLLANAVQRIPEQFGAVERGDYDGEHRSLSVFSQGFQTPAQLPYPFAQRASLLMRIKRQPALEMRGNLTLMAFQAPLVATFEYALENTGMPFQRRRGDIELMGMLCRMNAIAHTRHGGEDKVREQLPKLNHELPVTRPANSHVTAPRLEKGVPANDGRRGGDIAVVNQQVRNLIAPAPVIFTAMPGVARPFYRITLLIDPTDWAVTQGMTRIAFQRWEQAHEMTGIHVIVGHE